jgi:hypothetical protein
MNSNNQTTKNTNKHQITKSTNQQISKKEKKVYLCKLVKQRDYSQLKNDIDETLCNLFTVYIRNT